VRNQLLNDHEALVEIYAGDSAVYELILTKEKNYFRTIDKIEFDRLSQLYLNYISDAVSNNSHFNDFISVSRQLYSLLFGHANIPAGRIIISPDGHFFPFESLVTSYSNGTVKYFLNDYSVNYTYSARYMLNDFEGDGNIGYKRFIGFAPVTFREKSLVDLTGSDVSLGKLQSYFGGEKLLKEEASKANFLKKFYAFQIIQLYAHASDSGRNGEPVIWFADSALALSDLVYEHKPATKLIVLSACETGKGKLYRGEGIFNFNRGFAALGIPSSVSNLWSVENKSSYQITELFYKYLNEGMPVDVALQRAKLHFISVQNRGRQLPYYWAASIFIGINESFVSRGASAQKLSFLILFIAALSILLGFIFCRPYLKANEIANYNSIANS